ncbi:hypothetical protein OOZ19_10240 [Saccharopolyspora sp. NFXS83]|uniref:hypothetical protein n=1 Tax=Saccharopolyspora sp. NFXS83 TaxID=2993560 RepID=UPI00224AB7BD|nr:hypothetical protein [Saccharopolyspora sp. NFXS83]MCX2730621.1 hypothetical protein [Saccharopolyspora sp. NFXS83]
MVSTRAAFTSCIRPKKPAPAADGGVAVVVSVSELRRILRFLGPARLPILQGIGGPGESSRRSDWIIDLGPGAGHDGGQIVFEDTSAELVTKRSTHTGEHLAEYVDA